MKKYLFLGLGILCLIAGIIGIVLPILPTTPLFLASAWLFARSSHRFHRWLLHHKLFGQYIRDYVEHGAVRRRARKRALILLWSGMAITVILVDKLLVTGVLILIGSAVTYHILRLRVLPEEELPEEA